MEERRYAYGLAMAATLAGSAVMALMSEYPAHADGPHATADITSHATRVHPDGYEPGSVLTNGNCKGWLNTKKIRGHWYAQAVGQCWNEIRGVRVWLDRRHGGGYWTQISGMHRIDGTGKVHTGFYWDDKGYKARVCFKFLVRGGSYIACGKGV